MDKKELIKRFIDKLVLEYKNTEYISDLIKKLNSVEEFDSVTNNNGVIKCSYNEGRTEILFDEANREIIIKDKSEVEYDDKTVTTFIENTYVEDLESYHVDTKKTTEEKSKFEAGDLKYETSVTVVEKSTYVNGIKIIEDERTKKTDRYKNDIHVYTAVSSNYNKFQERRDGELLLLDGHSNGKTLYLLNNGDVLKISNTNGLEEYYYCDSGEINEEDKKDETKAKFNRKISYLSFLKTLENASNGINIEEKNKNR